MSEQPTTSTAPAAAPAKPAPVLSPSEWKRRKRPPAGPTFESLRAQQIFDAFFAGAALAGRWDDDNTLLTEAEFDAAIKAVGEIEIGGHHPDGTHPRAPKAKG